MVNKLKKERFFFYLFVIVILGLSLRLTLAHTYFGTGDVVSWEKFSTYWQEPGGLNKSPYSDDSRLYCYAPPWFWIITLTSYIGQKLGLHFSFAIKLPLILTDILILWVLILACRRLKKKDKDTLLIAGCFFLNPVSVLISGYHGQFGNISLFFALLAWYLYEFKERTGFWLSSLMLSLSVAIKHFTIMLAPVFAFGQKRLFKKLAIFVIAPAIFIITILPYFLSDTQGVVERALSYNLHAGYWGWSGVICRSTLFFTGIDFIKQPWFRYMDYFNYGLYIFIFVISFYIIKRYDLLDSIILIFLIFYTFTTQIAPQYTAWIIPFAALKRGKYFYWYSIIGAIQLIAFFYCHHHWRLDLPFVGTIPNLIPETFIIFRYLTWLICVLWLADYIGLINFVRRKVFAKS